MLLDHPLVSMVKKELTDLILMLLKKHLIGLSTKGLGK